jgi:thioester reductase-like protein
MVPSDFVVMKALPLSPTGKVDRSALPAPGARRPDEQLGFVAPRDELEEKVAAVWSELLGIARVGVHDDFFALGGHSLMVSRVVFRIHDLVGIELPMRALYEAPTIAGIAGLIRRTGDSPGAGGLCFTPSLRLEDECRLDDDITAGAPPVDSTRPPEHVLLTGASGYVGAHLLAELLATTTAHVHCLVRAQDLAEARARLRKTASMYCLRSDVLGARVHPVVGDLAAERLGLSPAAFDRLASQIHVIYHNGARVDHVRGYSEMKAANVLGTHEVLRLACRARLKPVHFVSTLGVVYPPDYAAAGRVPEDAPAGPLGKLPNGYMQSKCVAEHLVSTAMARGVPASIYRLGAITGHSVTGACNPDDYTYSALRSTVQLGFADDLDTDLTITPVDFAARAIVALSGRPQSAGKVFHVVNPRPLFWLDLVRALRERGYGIRVVSYAECMAGLLDAARRGVATPMLAFLPFITQKEPGNARYVAEDYHSPVRWSCENTIEGLAALGVQSPPPPERLLDIYLEHLTRNDLSHPPVRT